MKRLVSCTYGWWILLGIILPGSYFRIHGIIDGSFAYTYDVGRDMLALQKIVVQKDVPLIGPTTGLPGLFYGPWWYYLLIPAFIIGNGSPQAIAIFIALTGITTIILGYFLGEFVADKRLGIIFASLLSFPAVMIALTSQIWNPNLAPIFLIIIFWLFALYFYSGKIKIKQRVLGPVIRFIIKKSILLFLLGIFTGLSIDAEIVYGLLLCGSITLFLLYFLVKHKKVWYVGLYLLGLLIIFSPRIAFEFRHQFVMTNHLLSLIISGSSHGPFITHLGSEAVLVCKALKTLWDETVALQQPVLGWIFLLVTGGILFVKRSALPPVLAKLVLLAVFTIVCYVVGLSFFQGDIWSHYIVGLPVLFLFLFSVAMYEIIIISPYRLLSWMLFALLLVIYINPSQMVGYYYTRGSSSGNASLYRNQVAAIDYIYQKAHGRKFNYVVYTPPVVDYTYQYLFSWYAKKRYGYAPSSDKQNLYFYIIEPDTLYEYRLTHWLEDRQGDGKLLYDKALPSGIRIEERTH